MNLTRQLYLDQATVAGKSPARGHFISGENVHAASAVQPLIIRPKPGPRIQAGHPRLDAVCYLRRRQQFTSIVEDPYLVAMANATRLGVSRVKPEPVVRQRLEAGDVVQCGIDSGL